MSSSSRAEADLDTRGHQREVVRDLGRRTLSESDLDRLPRDAADAVGSETTPIGRDSLAGVTLRTEQPVVEESGVATTTGDIPCADGDTSQLRQVFRTLLSNAIKYSSDESPRVHVSAERDRAEGMLAVRDEGVGIPPDATERVFDVFTSISEEDENDEAGIGLPFCERVIERHGGDARVESEASEGSMFALTRPAAGDGDE